MTDNLRCDKLPARCADERWRSFGVGCEIVSDAFQLRGAADTSVPVRSPFKFAGCRKKVVPVTDYEQFSLMYFYYIPIRFCFKFVHVYCKFVKVIK